MRIAPSFVIYKDGTTFLGRNGSTGANDYSAATWNSVLSSIVAVLPASGGRVDFAPDLYPSSAQVAVDLNGGQSNPRPIQINAYGSIFESSLTTNDAWMFYDNSVGNVALDWNGGLFRPTVNNLSTHIGLSFGQDASYNSKYFGSNSRYRDISVLRNGGGFRNALVIRVGAQGVGLIDNCSAYAPTTDGSSIGGLFAGPGVSNQIQNFQGVGALGMQLGNNTGGTVAGVPNATPFSTSIISATFNNLAKGLLLSFANRNRFFLDLESNTVALDMGSGNTGNLIEAYFTGNGTNKQGALANNQILSMFDIQGQVFPGIYGQDSRGGLTSADGAPIGLYTTDTASIGLFRVTITALATAYTSGSPVYTLTWTQNGLSKTISVTLAAANALQTATALCNPDTGTQITVQLTGAFTATVRVGASLERLV